MLTIIGAAVMAFNDVAVGVVFVVVAVGVKRYLRLDAFSLQQAIPKQREISWIVSDLFRVAMAADMLVKADHRIRGSHHQMQVMGNEQNAAVAALTYVIDQRVKRRLAANIYALDWFIQH